jgi:hypothetical protein
MGYGLGKDVEEDRRQKGAGREADERDYVPSKPPLREQTAAQSGEAV